MNKPDIVVLELAEYEGAGRLLDGPRRDRPVDAEPTGARA